MSAAETAPLDDYDPTVHVRGIGIVLERFEPHERITTDAGKILQLFARLDDEARATVLTVAETLTQPKQSLTPRSPAMAPGFFRAVCNMAQANQALLAQVAWKLARWEEMYPEDLLTPAQANADTKHRWELPASTVPPDWWKE